MDKNGYFMDECMRQLMASVVIDALVCLKSSNHNIKNSAVSFLKSVDCMNYCDALNINYDVLRNININNINNEFETKIKNAKNFLSANKD